MHANDLFATITAQLIDDIETGAAGTWRMPWHHLADAGTPTSIDHRPYRGMNAVWLAMVAAAHDWTSGTFGTYRAWQRHGAQVRRGERATQVVLWKPTNPADADSKTDDSDDTPTGRPRLIARAYAVFAAEQCDGADEIITRRNQQRTERDTPARIDAAEQYLAAVAATVIEGGNRAEDAAWFGVEFARAGMDFLSLSTGGKFEDAKQPKVGQAAYPYTGPSGYECMPTIYSDERGPFARNLPALLGLLTVWYADLFGASTVAVLPYEQYLKRFPAYLQQLTMESNGKSVRLDGATVGVETGAIFWGEPGTNGQHSFYQLIHQGTSTITCDFLFFLDPVNPLSATDAPDHHDLLVANVLAQSAVLAFGKTAQEVAADGTAEDLVAHKVMPGNRPSSVIFSEKLDPRTLGRLVALYEHSVFTQGVVWGINSFDQWGVELGKVMAKKIAPLLTTGGSDEGLDSSTQELARRYREHKG